MEMMTGGCLCGAVRYEAQGKALWAVHCHCRDCQRASGTGHVPSMGMPKSLFKVTGKTAGAILAEVRNATGKTAAAVKTCRVLIQPAAPTPSPSPSS